MAQKTDAELVIDALVAVGETRRRGGERSSAVRERPSSRLPARELLPPPLAAAETEHRCATAPSIELRRPQLGDALANGRLAAAELVGQLEPAPDLTATRAASARAVLPPPRGGSPPRRRKDSGQGKARGEDGRGRMKAHGRRPGGRRGAKEE